MPSHFHYTSFAGLKGILETGSLWATYTKTLNDGSEFHYGQSVIKDYLASHLRGTPSWEQIEECLQNQTSRTFVVCFCESPDLLSMWRGYAGLGGGFCLEFEGPDLLGASFSPFATRHPFKVTYGNAFDGPLQAILSCMVQFARRSNIEAMTVASWIDMLALKMKDAAFSEERERRIIIPNPSSSELKFRPGYSDVKPYIELHPMIGGVGKLPLKRIVYGPTLRHDDALVESLTMMLERYGYADVVLEPCKIPYRL
jgi:hypothetical protein